MQQKFSNEKKLIKNLIKGNRDAYAVLFYQYASNLLSIAQSYLHDREESEEIVQETFYRVWKYRENMDASLSFKAYIITIAKRLIFNRAKKKMHEIAYKDYYLANQNSLNYEVDDYISFHELDNQLQKAIDNLPEKRRQIFVMSRQKGLSNQEIATQLGISVSTVENHMNKELNFLRNTITTTYLLIIALLF
ncbi:MAG: RNA polymerase sigma-70 factor [Cyclobacteriaceae bacterium]